MKAILACALLAAVMIASAAPVKASSANDSLVTCLADSTTGRDRKDLAQWIFVMMSVHPEIRSIAPISEETRDQHNQAFARVVTKLMTDTCAEQVTTAVRQGGADAVTKSFEFLGQLAMQELMSNAEVNSAFGDYTEYLDEEKFEGIFSP